MSRFADVVGAADEPAALAIAAAPERLDIAIVAFRLGGEGEAGLALLDKIARLRPECTTVLMAPTRPVLLPDSLVTLRTPFTADSLHSVLTTAVALKTADYPGAGWRYDQT